MTVISHLYILLWSYLQPMWDLSFSQHTPTHPTLYWTWCVDDMVGSPFNGSRIGSDTILKCGFGPNSTPKASSQDEGCLPLLYSIVAPSRNVYRYNFSYTHNSFNYDSIGKNPSATSAKEKAKLEYISEGQPSPLELAFGVELDLNSHSKILRWYQSIFKINPKGHTPSPISAGREGVY